MKKFPIIIVILIIVVAASFLARSIIALSDKSPVVDIASNSASQPSEEEATAAVRRFKVGFNTFTTAALKLGDCAPSTMGPGVACTAQVVLRPDMAPQNRTIGFARVNGQWDVSVW